MFLFCEMETVASLRENTLLLRLTEEDRDVFQFV